MNLPGGWESKHHRLFLYFFSNTTITSASLGYQAVLPPYSFFSVWKMQARVIHNTSLEWLQIKEATEKARDEASSKGDEIGEMTCLELLEALELSRCLFFMRYD